MDLLPLLFMNNVDKEYFRLLKTILENGRRKKNRTGVDTISVFGEQAKFDINLNAFPILTTKKVFFKGILHELLWFIKGDTNIKYLVDNNVHIWDEWAYKRYSDYWDENGHQITYEGRRIGSYLEGCRSSSKFTQDEFIQKIKDDAAFAKEFGELGEGTYGGMWRAFPYANKGDREEYNSDGELVYGLCTVDQLKKVVDKLKSNPDDRRMIISAWHPYWVDHCALPPCHCLFHFNTEELTFGERLDLYYRSNVLNKSVSPSDEELLIIPKRKLNCLLYQRSCDTFLGVPFNITSYCLLTAMIAHCVDMVPGVFTHTYGDLHCYDNHMEQIKIQLSRQPKELPKLWINPDKKDLFSLTYDDIRLEDYNPHPAIKADVAV